MEEVRILAVCHGNTCRSYILEQILEAYIERSGLKGLISVDSAGFWAINGLPPEEKAVKALYELGYQPKPHKTRSWLDVGLESYDLILVFEESHIDFIRKEFPELAEKALLIGSFYYVHPEIFGFGDSWEEKIRKIKSQGRSLEILEIPDPYHMSLSSYLDSARKIEICVKNFVYYLFGR